MTDATPAPGSPLCGLDPYERIRLEKLRLATESILELADDNVLPAPLESELYIFRDRVHSALLLPESAADLLPWRSRGLGTV